MIKMRHDIGEMTLRKEDISVEFWLTFLVTLPGAISSALIVYDWYKMHKKGKK